MASTDTGPAQPWQAPGHAGPGKPEGAGTPLLRVVNLSAGYDTPSGLVRAVRDVNLELAPGEVLGIAGESGCGKSTLAFGICGLLEPPGRILGGEVWFGGRDLLRLPRQELRRMRWREFSVVLQASMNVLNPVLRVREQVLDAARAHGLRDRKALEARLVELFRMVNLSPRFLTAYPHQLSGGMRQRVAIASALVLRPRLVIMDEPTTGLDVVVQRAILQEIDRLRKSLGFAVVFITHDLSLLVEISDRIAIMYAGSVVEWAPSRSLHEAPLHPYTQRLMEAFPPLSGPRRRLAGIPGQPPDPGRLSPGCPFEPRCSRRIGGLCEVSAPGLAQVQPGHWVACHLYAAPVEGGRPA